MRIALVAVFVLFQLMPNGRQPRDTPLLIHEDQYGRVISVNPRFLGWMNSHCKVKPDGYLNCTNETY